MIVQAFIRWSKLVTYRRSQRYFSYMYMFDDTYIVDVQVDWRRSLTYGRVPTS